MEIVVLVLGIVGFVMSWVIVGAAPAVLAILLGLGRLAVRKKPLRKLGRFEIILGIIFAVLAIGVSVYVYVYGVMDVDFVKLVREWINEKLEFLDFLGI
ncbi:MAG: hypothetical protein J5574_05060 [Lachnospiraceae bacterium]|nr:hypothetical protein [Lachnospiraceae bacterium]